MLSSEMMLQAQLIGCDFWQDFVLACNPSEEDEAFERLRIDLAQIKYPTFGGILSRTTTLSDKGLLILGYLECLTRICRAISPVTIGMFQDYEDYSQMYLPGYMPAKGIWIAYRSRIHPEALIIPPAIVGNGCDIPANSVIGPYGIIIDTKYAENDVVRHSIYSISG